jgi:glycosyltransferase involved in cell wall biosynthesis
MRILFVVDGRSPIALNWIRYFLAGEHAVHLASTFPSDPLAGVFSFHIIPVAFSGSKAPPRENTVSGNLSVFRRLLWSAGLVRFRTWFRQWLGPLTFSKAAKNLADVIRQVQPDLIHAMRIPYEGIISALALEQVSSFQPPLLISTWGNDFTLHAAANPWMAAYTRRTLKAAAGLHTDCQRDQRLAYQWGFQVGKPAVVLPGNGGIQLDLFCPPVDEALRKQAVINPRGVRAYVRNDTFFKSIPKVLERFPQARFICTSMAGDPLALRWLSDLGIERAVDLLPQQPREEMASLFQSAQVVVSPSTHDGTPNTLLEAMACGCYPVVGDIESLREWITPGVNGALIDPGDPHALADAVCAGLADAALRRRAAAQNQVLVSERAEYGKVMREAEQFYNQIVNRFGS